MRGERRPELVHQVAAGLDLGPIEAGRLHPFGAISVVLDIRAMSQSSAFFGKALAHLNSAGSGPLVSPCQLQLPLRLWFLPRQLHSGAERNKQQPSLRADSGWLGKPHQFVRSQSHRHRIDMFFYAFVDVFHVFDTCAPALENDFSFPRALFKIRDQCCPVLPTVQFRQ